eukprot:scaffold2532_cov79-Skeletonema_menzelii.AAC.4
MNIDKRRINNALTVENSYTTDLSGFRDKTHEVIEFTRRLNEEAQLQTEAKAKVEQGEEMEEEEEKRLNKLLPEALQMFMNGERRKAFFTSDHISSLLRLHLVELLQL